MNDWIVNSAKTIGKSHQKANPLINCQDYVITTKTSDVTMIALSDGCGSQPFSEFGSKIVTEVITKIVTTYFDKIYKHNLFLKYHNHFSKFLV